MFIKTPFCRLLLQENLTKVLGPSTPLLALEFGSTSFALKEGRKRLAQIQKGLVRGIFRDFPGPGELLTPNLVELLLEL